MASLVALISQLWRSPALRTTLIFGFFGIAFAVANLILSRALPILEYAVFTLVITFFNVGIPLAPLGADVVVNRRDVRRDVQLLLRTLTTSLLTAILTVWIAGRWYSVDSRLLWVIGVALTAGGVNYVAGAHFQSRHQLRVSLLLLQGVNFVIVVVALLVWLMGVRQAWLPLVLVGGSYLVFALVGWGRILSQQPADLGIHEPFLWKEALSCVGVSGVSILLVQLERLLIPQLLTLDVMATYGVLAAIVGSVFRMLLMGVGYSLLPRLRGAADVSERRRLLRRELYTVGAVVAIASVGIWVVTPWLVEWTLAGKYLLEPALILSALVNGVFKVGSAFARAAATALGDNRELRYLNWLGWVAVALAVGGSAIGARWGLPGVLYGVSLGWLSQGLFAAWIAAPHLKQRAGASDSVGIQRDQAAIASSPRHHSITRSL